MVKATPPHNPHADPIAHAPANVTTDLRAALTTLESIGAATMAETEAEHRVGLATTSRFASLTSGPIDEIEGADLERDKEALQGIPFIITSVTFRDGVKRDSKPTNYVSVELTVADRATLFGRVKAGRVSQEQAARVDPDSQLVINDGGTGICRQLVQYLAAKNLITVPDGPEGGTMGESRYDIHYGQWGYSSPAMAEVVANGGDPGFTVRLLCGRGLRSSQYEAEATGTDATTWYIA